jgi:Zn-dependent protease
MEYLFLIIILIFSVVIHEVSHGMMANYLGDPTAKNAGRLTLNPIKHLDPIGSIIVPIFLIITTGTGIGWAKPVPINPYNFRDQKYGSAKVALAGPGSNLILAFIFGLFNRFLPLSGAVKENIVSSLFLRGGGDLYPLLQGNFLASIFLIFSFIVIINILLATFNLIPISPLDGSHILFTFLPPSLNNVKIFLTQFGFFIIIFIVFFFPWAFHFIFYIVNLIFSLIVGIPSS